MTDKKAGSIEPDLVRELAAILRETDLTEIEVAHGELRLRVARTVTHAAPAVTHAVVHAPAPAQAIAAASAAAPEARPDARNNPGAVLSPMVGTAYHSPEPGAVAFVKVGDTVTEGQTLLIVEAMKTFNPIPAPRAGRVAELLVSDGQPVEFGQPLAILE